MAEILKTGIILSTGEPNENLFMSTSMTDYERAQSDFVVNSSTDWTKTFVYYNGNQSNHTFKSDTDTILLSSASNLGIAFRRKATDINLDSTSDYTLSCIAKTTKANTYLSIGLSYYNTSNAWVWRGGTNKVAFNALNTWQAFTLTFKPDADTQYICYCFTVVGEANGTDTFTIKHCKLEKGSIATAWIPNANDVLGMSSGGLVELDDNCKIHKSGYIQSVEFIEI